MTEVPDFMRQAMLAQGKVDPDEIAQAAWEEPEEEPTSLGAVDDGEEGAAPESSSGQLSWADNDALFRELVATGHRYERIVCELLRAEGIDAIQPEKTVRDSIADVERYADEQDIIVPQGVVEVKSRRYRFTSTTDFPFDSAIVDTADGWQRKQRKPIAVVNISQPTGRCVVIPVSSSNFWRVGWADDRVRGIRVRNLYCPKQWMRDWDQFVLWLR
jgi:hypothetical protein